LIELLLPATEFFRHAELGSDLTKGTDDEAEGVHRRADHRSDGFPHFVHLIGDAMFWAIFHDLEPVMVAGLQHFRAVIEGALERSDALLRGQYDKATQKTKNTDDYQEALWAAADTTSDRRRLQGIYEYLIPA
jgi:hypothetical protein